MPNTDDIRKQVIEIFDTISTTLKKNIKTPQMVQDIFDGQSIQSVARNQSASALRECADILVQIANRLEAEKKKHHHTKTE